MAPALHVLHDMWGSGGQKGLCMGSAGDLLWLQPRGSRDSSLKQIRIWGFAQRLLIFGVCMRWKGFKASLLVNFCSVVSASIRSQ